MVLTPEQLYYVAVSASWKIQVDFHTNSDSVVLTGMGVNDIDKLVVKLTSVKGYPKPTYKIDVGTTYDKYVTIGLDDLAALRATFVSVYGEVPKPSVWNEDLMSSVNQLELNLVVGNVATAVNLAE